MLDILLYISGVFVGWYFGSAYQIYIMRKTIKSLLNQIDNPTAIKNNETTLTIEEVNNVFYVYDSETNEFICQGATIEEVAENFNKRKGNISASLVHNNTTIFFIDGKVASTQPK